jgi:hypothetical protein
MVKSNVLVMEFLGENGWPAPRYGTIYIVRCIYIYDMLLYMYVFLLLGYITYIYCYILFMYFARYSTSYYNVYIYVFIYMYVYMKYVKYML